MWRFIDCESCYVARIHISQELNQFLTSDWSVGAGDTKSFKSVTAFYPEEAADSSSVTVVITSVGPDFTSLKSFGSVDAFAESLVKFIMPTTSFLIIDTTFYAYSTLHFAWAGKWVG